jgi:hypothetical protein
VHATFSPSSIKPIYHGHISTSTFPSSYLFLHTKQLVLLQFDFGNRLFLFLIVFFAFIDGDKKREEDGKGWIKLKRARRTGDLLGGGLIKRAAVDRNQERIGYEL